MEIADRNFKPAPFILPAETAMKRFGKSLPLGGRWHLRQQMTEGVEPNPLIR